MDKLNSLGIDLPSMLMYLVNTGVLLVVLTYLLYKPILKFIDQRRNQIADNIEEAQKLQKTFEEKLQKSEKERTEAEAKLKNELENMQKFVENKRKELVAEMEVARSEMIEKAQTEIDQKKATLLQDAEEEVKKLMTKIILHIVENNVPEDVIQSSIKSAWKTYSK